MDILDKALNFAIERHSGQLRKYDRAPYILHPLEVCAIVGTMTFDRDVLSAAVLHDTVEDTDTTMDEIREQFGERVAALVATETEDKRESRPPAETWQIRKYESLNVLKNTTDINVKKLWLGDKLSNMRSFSRAYLQNGDKLWESFNQKDPKKQAWYYSTIMEYLRELDDFAAYKEYEQLVKYVFHDHL